VEGVGGVVTLFRVRNSLGRLPAHHAEAENPQVFGGDDPQGVY